MNENNESRRAKRVPVKPPIAAENAISGEKLGLVGNISSSGLMLICPRALRDNAIYQIRLSMPENNGIQAFTLDIGIHEQWTQPAPDSNNYWSGTRIIDISPKAETQLLEWLG